MNFTQQINIQPDHIRDQLNARRLETAPIFDFFALFNASLLSLLKNRFKTFCHFLKFKTNFAYHTMVKIITLVIGKVWICATNPEFAPQIRLTLRGENCSKVAVLNNFNFNINHLNLKNYGSKFI
jgi:hypothetical protein